MRKLDQIPADKLTERYVKIRNEHRELKRKHEQEQAAYEQAMEAILNALLAKMNAEGSNHIATPHGTAYISVERKAQIEDYEAFWNFIRENDRPDMVQKRATSSAVVEYNDEHPDEPVPGITIAALRKVSVRQK